jgi:hypothetical protein
LRRKGGPGSIGWPLQCRADLFTLAGSAQKLDVQAASAEEHLVQSRLDVFEFQRAVFSMTTMAEAE